MTVCLSCFIVTRQSLTDKLTDSHSVSVVLIRKLRDIGLDRSVHHGKLVHKLV